MSRIKSQSHLVHWITGSIVVSFIGGAVASFALAPYSPLQNFLFMVFTAVLMTGFAGISVYAGKHSWDIPSAGFVLLTISQGLFVSTVGLKQGEINYSAGVAGIIFMIPALIMICYF